MEAKVKKKKIKDMNINASDEVDGCHQSKAVGLDTMMDCSMSQDMNSQPTNQPSDN